MNMVRWIPSLTDEHIQQAVLAARAVIALDERLARAQHEIAERDAKIAEMRESAQRAEQERQRLVRQLLAVGELHGEAQQPACGDGCCTEGTGVCEFCDEPWPCKTYRVADGKEPA